MNSGNSEKENNSPEPEDGNVSGTDSVDIEEFKEMESELQELRDRFIRLGAEFENFRKRSLREKEEYRNYAIENLMLELLEVVDNFERALRSAKDSKDPDSVIKGVEMVYRQLYNILEKNGLERIKCEREDFDPRMHEAIMQVPASDLPENTVVDECRPGYMLNSKVIRPALVSIAKGDEEQEKEQ